MHEACSLKPSSNADDVVSSRVGDNNSDVTFTANSNLKYPHYMTLAWCLHARFVIQDRLRRSVVNHNEKGVVVARCSGCNNLRLIADHLGMFREKRSIEDILAARGEEVKKGNMETFNLTVEDLVGKHEFGGVIEECHGANEVGVY